MSGGGALDGNDPVDDAAPPDFEEAIASSFDWSSIVMLALLGLLLLAWLFDPLRRWLMSVTIPENQQTQHVADIERRRRAALERFEEETRRAREAHLARMQAATERERKQRDEQRRAIEEEQRSCGNRLGTGAEGTEDRSPAEASSSARAASPQQETASSIRASQDLLYDMLEQEESSEGARRIEQAARLRSALERLRFHPEPEKGTPGTVDLAVRTHNARGYRLQRRFRCDDLLQTVLDWLVVALTRAPPDAILAECLRIEDDSGHRASQLVERSDLRGLELVQASPRAVLCSWYDFLLQDEIDANAESPACLSLADAGLRGRVALLLRPVSDSVSQ